MRLVKDLTERMMPNIERIALTILLAVSAVSAQTLESWTSSAEVSLGGSLKLRCSARGPSGLTVRLACPLVTGAWSAFCFEECERPISAAKMPELQTAAARCDSQSRFVVDPRSGDIWKEWTIEYEFSNVSQRHEGNYTCQFMYLRSVSAVKVAPVPAATATSVAAMAKSTTESTFKNDPTDGAVDKTTPTSSTTTVNGGKLETEMARTVKSNGDSIGDWFQIEVYGPITLGHVVAVSLCVVTVLLGICLAVSLLICYCKRIRRKIRHTELRKIATAAADTTSTSASLQVGADALWNSPQIYADVEYSPLMSGGGRGVEHRQNSDFGSQGRGINEAAVSVDSSSGSFFSRDQLGRHSFRSVRQQHQVVNQGGASSAAESPALARQFQRLHPHSPQLPLASSELVPVSVLQLVAQQRVEIDRLSQQLHSSQRQLNQLVASNTDLNRCLSSRQLNSAARPRHESSPQQQQQLANEYQQDPGQCRSTAGGAYGSTDALTVETIDEEFEADGTLKMPARRQQ